MKSIERLMARKLGGELGAEEAAELERRLENDPAAAALFARMQDQWQRLGDLPPAAEPFDLAPELMAAARREADSGLGWAAAPFWARVCGGLALVCGSLLGMALAGSEGLAGEIPGEMVASSEVWVEPLSLSESYWAGIESLGTGDEESREGWP